MRSTVSTKLTVTMEALVKNLDQLDALMPQILVQFPQMIATMESTPHHDADHAQHHVGHHQHDGRGER